jgi:hypothetical protein
MGSAGTRNAGVITPPSSASPTYWKLHKTTCGRLTAVTTPETRTSNKPSQAIKWVPPDEGVVVMVDLKIQELNQTVRDAVDAWYEALEREPYLDALWCRVVTTSRR